MVITDIQEANRVFGWEHYSFGQKHDLVLQIPEAPGAKRETQYKAIESIKDTLATIWYTVSNRADLYDANYAAKPYNQLDTLDEGTAISDPTVHQLWLEDQEARRIELDSFIEALGIDDIDDEEEYATLHLWRRMKYLLFANARGHFERANTIKREWLYFTCNKKRYALYKVGLYATASGNPIYESNTYKPKSDHEVPYPVADYLLIDLKDYKHITTLKPLETILHKLLDKKQKS